MKFNKVELEQIKKVATENVIIVVSNGSLWVKELPEFGETTVNLISQNGRVQYIDDETKNRTKIK